MYAHMHVREQIGVNGGVYNQASNHGNGWVEIIQMDNWSTESFTLHSMAPHRIIELGQRITAEGRRQQGLLDEREKAAAEPTQEQYDAACDAEHAEPVHDSRLSIEERA